MKTKTSVVYPVHPSLATCYASVKGFNPNEEFSVWQKTDQNTKWLLLALAILTIILSTLIAGFNSIKDPNPVIMKAKEEGQLFLIALPAGISAMAIILISLNLFESWYAKRKAFKKMKKFACDYVEFMAVIDTTDEEIQRWSEQELKQACIVILEAERLKIDKMKSSRGKLSKLTKFTEIYEQMTLIGLRFQSVDTYIRNIRIAAKPKPKSPRTKPSKERKNKVVLQPAA